MSSDAKLGSYEDDLNKLGKCDFQSCDIELLKSFIDLLDCDMPHAVSNIDAHLLINLYVEDMLDKVGPIKLPCNANWTGRLFKQRCFDYFEFPLTCQTLLINSVILKDDQTLFSAGIRKSGDVLSVFLHKPYLNIIENNNLIEEHAHCSSEVQVKKVDSGCQSMRRNEMPPISGL